MVIRQLFSFLVLMCWATSTYALSSIQASVDRNPVTKGEYFVLTIAADEELDASNLDTSLLIKDFVVGRTSVSRSTQMINFDTTKETRWQILLAPKKLGNVTIPAFVINNIKSNTIPLTVVKSGATPTKMKNLYIETTLSAEEAYVGQLMTYTVKLYLALELQRGVLSAPVLEGAQIKQVGDDKDTNEIVEGRRFRVIERTYAITPDFPGELTIEGASFAGDVLINSPGRRGVFTFNESRPMQAKADKQVILVNSLPSHVQGNGLVADLVALKETWPQDQQTFEVGTPITRVVTLIASSADESSLPEPNQALPAEFKQYPEKPQRQTIVRNGRLVSQLAQTVAIVPTKKGQYTLPEISVPWWNPHLKQQEYARLPAKTITVIPSTVSLPPLINESTASIPPSVGYWPYLTLLFALLWLGTIGAWYRAKISQSAAGVIDLTSVNNNSQSSIAEQTMTLKLFINTCKQQDATACLNALQKYFTTINAQQMTLGSITQQYPELTEIIGDIQTSAYGNQDVSVDYQQVITLVRQASTAKQAVKKQLIKPLNP